MPRFVHLDFSFSVDVDSKAYWIFFEIINRVKVSKENITDQVKEGVFPWQSALMNKHVTTVFVIVQEEILRWIHRENVITELNARVYE